MEKELYASFYRKNRFRYIAGMFLVAVVTILTLVYAYLLQVVLDAANQGQMERIIYAIIGMTGLFLVLFLLQMLLKRIRCAFVRIAMSQYKSRAFEEITKKGITTFLSENTGSYLSVLTNDAAYIEEHYLHVFFQIISMCVSFLGAIALMLWYNWVMSLVSIAVCVLPIILSILFGEKMARAEKNISDKNENYVGMIKDLLGGFSVIKSFQAEKQAVALFEKENNELELLKEKSKNTKGTITIISTEIGSVMQIVVFAVGALLSIKGMITVGVVIAFVQLMNNIMEPIQALPSLYADRKAAKALIRKQSDFFAGKEKDEGTCEISRLERAITLNDVSFSYEEGSRVLKNIRYTFEKGKTYAIVGESGSGKSTLMNLLLKGYEDYQGEIYFDDVNLKQLSGSALYRMVSVVQQNVFIFNSSVQENITMFHACEKERFEDAVHKAGLDKLVHERGYKYLCGEGGANLSGGERQRISIARSLLKDTSVLIMDEATAALDAETSNNILNQILSLEGMTKIVITHRLEKNVLKQFDHIMVLRSGNITESGTFDELMERQQYFYSLYQISAGE